MEQLRSLLSELLNRPVQERVDLANALLASLPPSVGPTIGAPSTLDHDATQKVAMELRTLIAEQSQTTPEALDFDRPMNEQGIDSLHLVVLRERLQEAMAVSFSDDDWASLRTPASILAAVSRQRAAPKSSRLPSDSADRGPILSPAGLSDDELEIGMPLTGRNNLAETPLLQYLGDQRWRHISRMTGRPSREIVDEDGQRLYATFFYVEVAFPEATPMAAFGENDRFKVISTLGRYGTSMLDGVSYLVPARATQGASEMAAPFASVQEAIAAGVPAVRLSNVFVRQFAGAEWLKKGRPADPRFARIPSLSEPPDSYVLTKQAEREGSFGSCDAAWVPLTNGPVEREYRLVPDRDLNGAGLVYFANYPMFLDICERDVLLSARRPLAESLIDRRTLVRRQSAYLNNASAHETLRVEIEPWIQAREAPHVGGVETVDLRLHVNCRMYRRSDDRLMMVSTVQKVVRAVPVGDTPLAE